MLVWQSFTMRRLKSNLGKVREGQEQEGAAKEMERHEADRNQHKSPPSIDWQGAEDHGFGYNPTVAISRKESHVLASKA